MCVFATRSVSTANINYNFVLYIGQLVRCNCKLHICYNSFFFFFFLYALKLYKVHQVPCLISQWRNLSINECDSNFAIKKKTEPKGEEDEKKELSYGFHD